MTTMTTKTPAEQFFEKVLRPVPFEKDPAAYRARYEGLIAEARQLMKGATADDRRRLKTMITVFKMRIE